MTNRAAVVFAGRCLDVETAVDPVLGGEVTVATFEVLRAAKGGVRGTVQVRMSAGDDVVGVPAGLPTFQAGDEVILFLYGESALGLRAPVGLGQGRFKIGANKAGRPVARNDLGNRALFRGLTPAAESLLPVTIATAATGDLDPEDLLDWVEALVGSGP